MPQHFTYRFYRFDFTLDELIERVKGKTSPPQNIQEYLKQQLDDFQSRVGIDIAKTTYYIIALCIPFWNIT
jgi:hypothetical protein